MPRAGRAASVSELIGTLEGRDAQLVLSYIVWPGEVPDPRFVDEWVRAHPAPKEDFRRRRGRGPIVARTIQKALT